MGNIKVGLKWIFDKLLNFWKNQKDMKWANMKWDGHEMGHPGMKWDGHEMAWHEMGPT